MKRNLLLVNPPTPVSPGQFTPPLGLTYVASYALRAGHNVKIFDMPILDLAKDDLLNELRINSYDVVGFTSYASNINEIFQLCKAIKQVDANILTIAGGPFATFASENILRACGYLDICVRKEGEETMLNVLENTNNKNRWPNILGITYRDGAAILFNPDRPYIKDLDTIPFPARHLLPHKYLQENCPERMITSRGCPFLCTFCGTKKLWGQVRFRSLENVITEILHLKENFGTKWIRFADDTFTYKKAFVIKFCQTLIEREIHVEWDAYARVDTVDVDLIRLMKRAGCKMLFFGVESMDEDILKRVRKKTDPHQIERAIRLTHTEGIKTVASFVIGLPGENYKTVQKTLSFSYSPFIDEAVYSILTPFPGCEIYDTLEENGITITNKNMALWSQAGAVIKSGELEPETLAELWLEARLERKKMERAANISVSAH